MLPLYYQRKFTVSRSPRTGLIHSAIFILVERLEDYRTAQLAAAEYRAEGLCCRVEPVELKQGGGYYRIWTGPPRKVKVRTLSHEKIRRRKSTRILGVA